MRPPKRRGREARLRARKREIELREKLLETQLKSVQLATDTALKLVEALQPGANQQPKRWQPKPRCPNCSAWTMSPG